MLKTLRQSQSSKLSSDPLDVCLQLLRCPGGWLYLQTWRDFGWCREWARMGDREAMFFTLLMAGVSLIHWYGSVRKGRQDRTYGSVFGRLASEAKLSPWDYAWKPLKSESRQVDKRYRVRPISGWSPLNFRVNRSEHIRGCGHDMGPCRGNSETGSGSPRPWREHPDAAGSYRAILRWLTYPSVLKFLISRMAFMEDLLLSRKKGHVGLEDVMMLSWTLSSRRKEGV